MALNGLTNDEKIWNFCKTKGMTDFGAAGTLGNLDAESSLNPKNLQDSYETRLGFNDEAYAALVDSGVYTKTQFTYDCAGWGIAQWTWWARKKSLYEFAKSKTVSIADLEMQLEFFYKELSESYPSVLNILKTATSVKQASDAILLKYECPSDMSMSAQNRRAAICQKYYTKFVTNQNKDGESNMGYKTCKKGSVVKLSTYFNSTEFDCHGNGCCSQTLINEKLVEYLQKIREHFGQPITITSGYRCPTHNGNVRGATGSRHTKGDAADIVVKGITPREVAKYAESIGILGIGLYETSSDGYFVHVDTRTTKSYWYGQAQAYRSTFGGTPGSISTTTPSINNSTNTSVLDTILNRGDHGTAVKQLQEKLIKLGYSCGNYGADGDFGVGTESAVRKFQKEHTGLAVDGIAGYQTLKAIDTAIAELDSTGNKAKVTATLLNVRSGAGTNYKIISQIRQGTICEIQQESNGWYKLVSPDGWVSADYIEKI